MRKLARHATLRQLQVFEAIGRLRSFTRAAEELFLTQSTVSTQVKNLADVVGMPLVEYIGKQVYLTEAGRYLYQACQDILRTLDNVDMAVADLQGLKQGSLSVSVIATAKYFAPVVLGHFCQLYPEIEVSLNVSNREQVLERLKNNQDDVYILGRNPPADLDIHAEVFAPNPLYVMASKEHPLAKQNRSFTLEEIAEQPMLLREPGSGIRAIVEQMFSAKGLVPNVRMVLNSNESIKHALIGQLGISVLSLHSILLEGTEGPFAVLDVEGFPVKHHWQVVRPKGKELSVVAKRFVEFLKKEGEVLSKRLDKLSTDLDLKSHSHRNIS
jgi:DNA-binding transcriptional LysR family regulator